MLQIALLACSGALVFMGIKGFTSSGIVLSKAKTLAGSTGKIVGAVCILAGLALVPAVMLVIWAVSSG